MAVQVVLEAAGQPEALGTQFTFVRLQVCVKPGMQVQLLLAAKLLPAHRADVVVGEHGLVHLNMARVGIQGLEEDVAELALEELYRAGRVDMADDFE